MKSHFLSKCRLATLTLIAFISSSGWATVIEGNLEVKARTGANGDLKVAGTTTSASLTVGGVSNASVPRGVIVMWSGDPTDLPAGWALCNGENGTPNLSGRFVVGYDAANVDYDDVSTFAARTGGEDEPVISVDQMPSHNHSNVANGWYGSDPGPGNHMADNVPGGVTGNTGGNQPFDNRPAYFVIAYIIKL